MIVQATAIGKDRRETTGIGSQPVRPDNLFVLDPLRDARWPELVRRHPAASVFHSKEWLSALRQAYGYEPVVYTKCNPSSDLTSGIVFCGVKSWLTGRRLVSLPFSDHCDPLVENAAQFDDLLLPVRESVADGSWNYCEVRPARFEPGASSLLQECSRWSWHATDLRPSTGEIFENLHHSAQRKIRRAEREALVYEEGNSQRLLGHFYGLLVATRRRQSLPPQPLRWFRSLIANFGADLKIRVAYKDDRAIASILTLTHKNTVTFKYGCSEAQKHRLGGVGLLFWNMIQESKAAGHEKVDLGRSESSNRGLIAFKEHWGGICSTLSYWRYPNRQLSYEILPKGRIVDRIVKASPDRVLMAAGDLLYRHVG
jgi:hypothetical protein